MATNEQLTAQLGLDLGLDLKNRRPYAKEIFKRFDIELLPISGEDTLLGEIFEWSTRNWRTTSDNLVGYIGSTENKEELIHALKKVAKIKANVPDFEFSKQNVFDLGLKLPFFNLSFTGEVQNAQELSVKINGIKRTRLTNYEEPGIAMARLLSVFAEQNTPLYRNCIKHNYIVEALFYAESVEIDLKKEAGVDIGLEFDANAATIEATLETSTQKKYKIVYKDSILSPFGATFKKGKELFG